MKRVFAILLCICLLLSVAACASIETSSKSSSKGGACKKLKLSEEEIEFAYPGDTWRLEVSTTPADTKDKVTFQSSNPSVVTVDKDGLLTAVGYGKATIAVTCGKIVEKCQVTCNFKTSATEPTGSVLPTLPTEPAIVEAEYKLGMGVVVRADSSRTGLAQIDATVATVVTDRNGRIVACRIDVAQNKFDLTADFATQAAKIFETKMELGDRYGMADHGIIDNNDDGVVLEWDAQAKAFETYVVGKTAAEVNSMELQEVNGHMIAVDEALLSAGCTMQITDFIAAVVKACNDEQGMTFKTAETFTLGVAVKTSAADSTAATADADGTIKMYSDFAATVVAGGKIIAALNDAIQPNIIVNTEGEIVEASYRATKRELKEKYSMANYGMDSNGDGVVMEWYEQSAAFSKYVVGMTTAEVAALETATNSMGYQMSADEDLLTAGCTIQITGPKAIVAQAASNAR